MRQRTWNFTRLIFCTAATAALTLLAPQNSVAENSLNTQAGLQPQPKTMTDPQPSPQPPPHSQPLPGEVLFGDWTTNLRRTDPRSEIALEMKFTSETLTLTAICDIDQTVHLTASVIVPVIFNQHQFRILRPGSARTTQGAYYCESSIDQQLVEYRRERDDIYRLYFPNRSEPVYLFKKSPTDHE